MSSSSRLSMRMFLCVCIRSSLSSCGVLSTSEWASKHAAVLFSVCRRRSPSPVSCFFSPPSSHRLLVVERTGRRLLPSVRSLFFLVLFKSVIFLFLKERLSKVNSSDWVRSPVETCATCGQSMPRIDTARTRQIASLSAVIITDC